MADGGIVVDVDLARATLAAGAGAMLTSIAVARWLVGRSEAEATRLYATKADVAGCEARIRQDFHEVISTMNDAVTDARLRTARMEGLLGAIADRLGVKRD